jgi:hypothetical protein
MMTRKDFIKVAQYISSLENSLSFEARMSMAEFQCDIFADSNPRFNREKFLRACGLESK